MEKKLANIGQPSKADSGDGDGDADDDEERWSNVTQDNWVRGRCKCCWQSVERCWSQQSATLLVFQLLLLLLLHPKPKPHLKMVVATSRTIQFKLVLSLKQKWSRRPSMTMTSASASTMLVSCMNTDTYPLV